jgi:HAD superfamily hydrolase (TIGR01509 family)
VPALIFDYDGLMVDSERVMAECLVEALAQRGIEVAIAEFGHLFGSTEVDDEWERLMGVWSDQRLTMTEVEALLTPVVRARVAELPLLPGVVELIDEASSHGWKVGLATGQSRLRLEPQLLRLGVRSRFDAIVTAAEVPRGKPAPDIFLAVAGLLDTEVADCIVLEDSVPGCRAALAAGMNVVVCPSLVTSACEFPGDVRKVESLRELGLAQLVPAR